MAKEWNWKKAAPDEPETISGMLIKIVDEVCMKYCKYPDMYINKNQEIDSDMLEDMMYTEICANCPLMKI